MKRFSPPINLEIHEFQKISRLHRVGEKPKVVYLDLDFTTFEKRILENLKKKDQTGKDICDGSI